LFRWLQCRIVLVVESRGEDLNKTLARDGAQFVLGCRLLVSRLNFCDALRA